jgi:hypothetical protein
MEIQGKVIQLLPEASGEGRNGTWRKQEFILETQDQFPKKVCIALWGDRIDQFNVQVGDELTASVNVESREFNGRWYTDVKVIRFHRAMRPCRGLKRAIPVRQSATCPPTTICHFRKTTVRSKILH